ncbi:hypothetical protein [Deinococcus kurensis]|uniref:hypothetical protein n=1 Tax=Deinococcus kurensis TaxID=2662757 RepID=UPI0012D31665|nr:hypothetical protein [Deinococcus kurensis]
MQIKLRVKHRPTPASTADLRDALLKQHTTMVAAALHYGIERATLNYALKQTHLSRTAANVLSRDFNLRHLAAECDCGALYFPTTGGHKHCPECNTENP